MNITEFKGEYKMYNPFKKVYTAHIYMKSGNVLVLDKVSDISFKYLNSDITHIELSQSKKAVNKLRVQSIALNQIEAIVNHKPHWTLFW